MNKREKEKLIKLTKEAIEYLCLYFDGKNTLFTAQDGEEWDGECYNGYEVHCGASKFVIDFVDENLNYVVKIPFNGWYKDYYDWREEQESWINAENNYTVISNKLRERFNTLVNEDEDGELFIKFDCANNREFEMFYGWNYCALEEELYHWAVDYEVEEFFAPTEYLFSYNDYPIYVQQKCSIFNYLQNTLSTEEERANTKKKLKNDNIYTNELPEEWLAFVEKEHGYAKLKKLLAFIEKFDIEDLHNSNVGIDNYGIPKIIDYCGFAS